jgi:hypothetical protein
MLVLDKNFTIDSDGMGVILKFVEPRTRIGKNNETIEYIASNNYYYGSVPQALYKYKDLALESCETLSEVLTRLDEVETLIRSIKFNTKI